MPFTIAKIFISFGIIGTMIGYTMGLVGYNLINGFMESIIKPILNKVIKSNIDTLVINKYGMKFKIGKLIGALIDFVLTLFLIIVLLRFVFKDMIMTIIDNKEEGIVKQTELLQKIVDFRLPLSQ